MKRLIAMIIMAILIAIVIIGCGGSEDNSIDDCGTDRIVVKIRATAIADRHGTVYYHFFKTGGEPSFYIERDIQDIGDVNSSLCPGQFLRVKASFQMGQATPENTRTLTYDQALLEATPYTNPQYAKYEYIWKPVFDLTGE